jgi:hypothetical protein
LSPGIFFIFKYSSSEYSLTKLALNLIKDVLFTHPHFPKSEKQMPL